MVSVKTRFPLERAEIQGTWSHASPSGVRSTLVTFNKESHITDMSYRQRLLFREPNVSLTIQALRPDDEGDYQLKLNIQFHNDTGRVIREERSVHVTVDGEAPAHKFFHVSFKNGAASWQLASSETPVALSLAFQYLPKPMPSTQ